MKDITDNDIIKLFIKPNKKIEINNITKLNKHKYPEEIEKYLINRFEDSESFTETIYRIYYNIEVRPVCPVCGNKVTYLGQNKYRSHCSCRCSTLDKNVKEKVKKTCLEKYGVENPVNSSIVKEKVKKTCLEKYGTTSPLLNDNIKEKTKQTKLERYGDENFTNREKANNTIIEKFGDLMFKTNYFKTLVKQNNINKYGVEHSSQREDIKEKTKQTNIKKYGGPAPICSDVVKNKIQNTLKERTGYIHPYQIPEIHKKGILAAQTPEVNEKRKQTLIEKYGVDNYFKSEISKQKRFSEECIQKVLDTKRKNHTFNTSKPEEESYKLLKEKYPDVLYQYKSDVYPFACDFYIPSLDTYIECNYHWTHGGKPYEGTEEDNLILEQWKSKNTKFYNNAINCWTIRDVKKRNIAKQNNLNYLEFWDIEELKEWIYENSK